ncbi:hypothetical protein F5Y16DRAFT_357880 [Xylariaceae sp. FL0255]|nr:hypothetical protein F5Y16DRAFT_357880 [Xylariaceae sp. FL0255]
MDSKAIESLNFVLQNKILATTLAIGVSSLIYAYLNYRQYVSFGQHGLPPTLKGYWTQLNWHRIARSDVTVPAPYSEADLRGKYGPECWRSYFPRDYTLKPREGPPPDVPSFCAPQRQTNQLPPESILAAQNQFLGTIAAKNPSLFDCKVSGIEKVGPALYTSGKRDVRDLYKFGKGEFAHVHPEGSTHVFLSLVDSKTVLEQGWGQRHKLSGPMLPWGYTLLYGPRNEEEFDTWKTIVRASAEYFTY